MLLELTPWDDRTEQPAEGSTSAVITITFQEKHLAGDPVEIRNSVILAPFHTVTDIISKQIVILVQLQT